MKNLLLFCIITLATVSCSLGRKMPDNVLNVEKTEDGLLVHFDDKEPFYVTISNFDYKSRYATLKKLALLESNVNIVDNYGVSLLAYAAANGDADFVATILKQQDGPLILDNPDREESPPVYLARHPIELAILNGHYDVLKLLLENGYKPCCVTACIGKDRLDMLKLMCEHGAIIDDNSVCWAPPLICCAKSSSMVEYLVSKGCSIHKALTYAKSNYSKQELTRLELLINTATY